MKSKQKQAKKATKTITKSNLPPKKSTGLDEIDTLFAQKKQSDKQLQQQITQDKEQAKLERRKRKQARLEEEREELSLRGGGGTCVAVGNNSSSSSAPQSLHNQALKLNKLSYTRSDLEQLNDNNSNSEQTNKWASDGLGGIFNGEGYTGRKADGQRVFKAHLMNREGFGQSKDCPFDCQCCFI